MKKVILLLLTSILLFSSSNSQEQNNKVGVLRGSIQDASSKDDLIGVNVFIIGTKFGAVTDFEGKFIIKYIPAGLYDVRISLLGYKQQTISGVEILEEKENVLKLLLQEETIQADEVIVSAELIRSGEGAVIAERKKSAIIGDAVSSEQMKKAPDATTGDALRRITGVSIIDNKFIFIRGVTDRYNQTTLNGTTTPSTNVDKKSFSFDMLPSNLMDNMNVAKTATPDLPGDFTGGLVQMNTLDIPEKLSFKFVSSNSGNSFTTFKKFLRSNAGKNDLLGVDDGTRSFSTLSPTSAQLGSSLPNTWGLLQKHGPLAQAFSLSVGNRIDFDESQIGIIAAASYRNNFQHSEVSTTEYGNQQLRKRMKGFSDKVSILWGGLLNVSYKINDLHKLSFKNNLNQAAEDKIYVMNGESEDDDEYRRSYQIEWEERSMYSGQFSGEHFLPELFGTTIDWTTYFNDAKTNQPDRKEIMYTLNRAYSKDEPFSAKPGERSWGNIYEKNNGQKFHFIIPIENLILKVGAMHESRLKNYEMKFYQISSNALALHPENLYLLNLPIDQIYSQNNFSADRFTMRSFDNSSGSYSAKQQLLAYFAMTDFAFSLFDHSFRLIGGARVEQSEQIVDTEQGRLGANEVKSKISVADILPSVNLTYKISESQNLRLAYSHTVNRPEFREMSDFYFYDFDRSEYVHGNKNLQRALIQNYDIRYEIFPSYNDLFAVSYFYKAFKNPIEEYRTFTSFTERSWINADHGTNFGWELESRKKLGFIHSYFELSQIVANYTRVYSYIPYKSEVGNSTNQLIIEGERPMQGQSPYMLNVSLFITDPTFGTTLNVLYNEYGSRIDAVGDVRAGDGDVYEQKRGTLDCSIIQPLSNLVDGLEVKATVKNLNNQPITYAQGKEVYRVQKVGISYSLQASIGF